MASGDDIPRKGGPGITTADLLVVNKTDLAPHVGADLDTMADDAKRSAATCPSPSPASPPTTASDAVADWVTGRLAAWRATGHPYEPHLRNAPIRPATSGHRRSPSRRSANPPRHPTA